jgi:hypothetical protein
MGNMKVTTKLYFVYEGQLMSETRIVDVLDNQLEECVFNELLLGPQTEYYEEVLPGNAQVISFEMKEDTIFINLSHEFIENDFFNDDNFNLHVMAIVNTLTELKHYLQVQFLIEGEREAYQFYGLTLMETFKRDERLNFKREVTSEDVVVEFIDLIFNHRMDLAYQRLTDYSKKTYPYDVFQELMEGYLYYHHGYQRNIYFTQNYDDFDMVTVKFEGVDDDDMKLAEITEQWKVISDGVNLKIEVTETIRP